MANVVTIKNPESGEIREISRTGLGPWRRKGWILLEKADDTKRDLNPLAELVQDRAEEAPEVLESEEA